ncbi:MAG: hypothetical protein KZQ95_09640 [Candidatus Thiodiazotropha sp. (ex Epidulcina cf. delphinae)]|nr:hypothetical protein [Candidatus Thiodiazotropha sp. (ex Epidulcina cf. delphinae)]
MKNQLLSVILGFIVPFTAALAGETLYVAKTASAPTVDGVPESVWEGAQEIVIPLTKIPQGVIDANIQQQKGKYAKKWKKTNYTQITELRLKAVYDGERIFFLAHWKDDSKDDQHKPWKWEGDQASGEYLSGKEREDRLSLMFPISGAFDPNKLSGNEMVADVWQWKAARTNSVGLIHDKSHVISKAKPTGKSAAHYTSAGEIIYVARPGDGPSPYKSNKIDPFTYQGDLLPKYIPTRPDDNDATDVSAKGVWADNGWTLEIGRNLDTGHKASDTRFDPSKGSSMAAAVFNHVGDHFHAVSDVIQVVFDQ